MRRFVQTYQWFTRLSRLTTKGSLFRTSYRPVGEN
jgi:hypothetical protein